MLHNVRRKLFLVGRSNNNKKVYSSFLLSKNNNKNYHTNNTFFNTSTSESTTTTSSNEQQQTSSTDTKTTTTSSGFVLDPSKWKVIKEGAPHFSLKKQVNPLITSLPLNESSTTGQSYQLNDNLAIDSENAGMVALAQENHLLGFEKLILEKTTVNNKEVPLVKRLGVKVNREYQGKGVGKAIRRESQSEIEKIVNNNEKTIVLAGVNVGDSKSVKCYEEELGFEKIANFSCVHIYHKKYEYDRRVMAINTENNIEDVKIILQDDFYNNYQLKDDEFCNLKMADNYYQVPEMNNYFVFYKDGDIMAGARFIGIRDVKILKTPDATHSYLGSLCDKYVVWNNYYGLKSFRTSMFDQLFVREGYENELISLLKVVTTRANPAVHWIRLVGDNRCPVWQRAIQSNLDKFKNQFIDGFAIPLDLYGKNYGLEESEWNSIKQGPLLFPANILREL
ncbi:hypothetical protein ABK040_002847 [Willaertia magna]